MQLFILFMFSVLCLAALELRWNRALRVRYVLAGCALVAVAFSSLRVV